MGESGERWGGGNGGNWGKNGGRSKMGLWAGVGYYDLDSCRDAVAHGSKLVVPSFCPFSVRFLCFPPITPQFPPHLFTSQHFRHFPIFVPLVKRLACIPFPNGFSRLQCPGFWEPWALEHVIKPHSH